MQDRDHEEIMRLRDKVHDLGNAIVRLEGDLQRHDRAFGDLRDWVRTLQHRIDGMSHADEIATAVAQALTAQRRRYWTATRVALGGVVGVLTLVLAQLLVHLLVGVGVGP